MSERWLGLAVVGESVTAVEMLVPGSGPLEVLADQTIRLQSGERPNAYAVIQQQLTDRIKESKIDLVVIKASAVSMSGTKKAHLEAAELRGVVMCAASAAPAVLTLAKAALSRNFGERKVDEYLGDDDFWDAEVDGSLRVGSREAALLLLAARQLK